MASAARFSVTFDPKSAERLDRLAADDQSKAEMIRPPLSLEDLYRQVTAPGWKLLIQPPDGLIAEVVRS